MRPLRLVVGENHGPSMVSHRLPLVAGAVRAGYDVHVVLPRGEASPALVAAGATVHEVPLARHGQSPAEDAQTFAHLLALYRRLRPAIVHNTTWKPILYGTAAARLAGVRVQVASFTGLGHVFWMSGARAELRRRALVVALHHVLRGAGTHALFQNDDDRLRLSRPGAIDIGRSSVIRSAGVDTRRFAPAAEPAGEPVVLLPARMLWIKGAAELVEAARILRARGVYARFDLAGGLDATSPGAIAVEQLHAWELEGVATYRGESRDMPSALAAAHVVCLPSHAGEGVPRVLLEAAACARPVVTTDTPGCRDAVVDGVTGLIVPPGDSARLAEALERLVGDAELRQRMGRAGRAHVEGRFSDSGVVEQMLALYRELLDEPRAVQRRCSLRRQGAAPAASIPAKSPSSGHRP